MLSSTCTTEKKQFESVNCEKKCVFCSVVALVRSSRVYMGVVNCICKLETFTILPLFKKCKTRQALMTRHGTPAHRWNRTTVDCVTSFFLFFLIAHVPRFIWWHQVWNVTLSWSRKQHAVCHWCRGLLSKLLKWRPSTEAFIVLL